MYLATQYRIESVTRTEDGEVFQAVQHVPSGTKGRRIRDIEAPPNIDLAPGDIVRLRVENHSTRHGWVLDKFIGFPYDKERAGWDPIDGVGEQ